MSDRYQDDLKAYLDGELSPLARLAVRLHLTRCASCREEIAQMTQIAEDLRTAEMDGALDPDLRAKLLQIGPVSEAVGAGSPRPSSPTPPELGAGGRKRPPLGWAIAGTALVAWFICFPALQKTRQGASYAPTASMSRSASDPVRERQISVFKHLEPPVAMLRVPPPPPKVQPSTGEHFSDPVAGMPVNGNTFNRTGATGNPSRAQTFTPAGNVAVSPDAPADPTRQVHKEASIGVQVPNPETTSDTVETMVRETGGYVASNNLRTGDDQLRSAEMTVKVPVAQFETFLSQVAKLGSVQSKSVNGEDITEKTSDADQTENVLEDDVQKQEARLKALGSRAKWHDEQATRDLRIQLAQARARLILLKRMATLGTITVNLSQTPPKAVTPPVTGGFLNGLKASTHDALQSLVSSASALVALGIWLLAYAPIWLPLLLVGRYVMREYRKRQVV